MTSYNVLVIETALSGHRGEYVRWIVQALLESNHKVILALPDDALNHQSILNLNHPMLKVEAFDNELLVESFKWIKRLGLFGNDYLYYRLFKILFLRVKQHQTLDRVFIPFIDHALYSISILGSPFGDCPFSGITMRPDFHYRAVGVNAPDRKGAWFKEFIFDRFLKKDTLSSLLTLDEALHHYYRTKTSHQLQFLPEPANFIKPDILTTKRVEFELGITSESKIILVYGSLTKRKGVINLLKAMLQLDESYDFQVILAGKADDDINSELNDEKYAPFIQSNKLLRIDRFITTEEERVLFSVAYCCWLGYIGHYRASGVLIQACVYNLPVLATNEGIIGWQVEKHDLGILIDTYSVVDIEDAIRDMLCNEDSYYIYKDNTKKAFLENTFENAKKIIANSL